MTAECVVLTCRWTDASNWASGVAPVDGDDLLFQRPGISNLRLDQTRMVSLLTALHDLRILYDGGSATGILGLRGIAADAEVRIDVPTEFWPWATVAVSNANTVLLGKKVTIQHGLEKTGMGSLYFLDEVDGSFTVGEGLASLSVNATKVTGSIKVDAGAKLYLNQATRDIGMLEGAGEVIGFGENIINLGAGNASGTFGGLFAPPSYISDMQTINKVGTGTWTIGSTGTLKQAQVKVMGGALIVDGQVLEDITVDGGTLGGSGQVQDVAVSHGTIAPGSNGWIGTLTARNVTLQSGTVLQADFDPTLMAGDKLVADHVTLDGKLVVRALPGIYMPGTNYDFTVIQANILQGDVTQTGYHGLELVSNLAFLAASMDKQGDKLVIRLENRVNDHLPPPVVNTPVSPQDPASQPITFASVALTPNQAASAQALQALGAGNPIYDHVIVQTQAGAQAAFDAVSGESHATQNAVFLQDSAVMRLAAMNRARLGSNAQTGGGAVMSYLDAGQGQSYALSAGDATVWGGAYGGVVRIGGNGNATDSVGGSGGLQAGADDWFGDFRLGLMVNAGRSQTSVANRTSSLDSTDYGLGIYGGTHWGDTVLSLGASYQRHDIASTRTVAFPGFVETLEGQYGGSTAQLFGELSHSLDLGGVAVDPYAQLAYVQTNADAFTETGGASALSVDAQSHAAVFTTLGVRVSETFELGDDMQVKASAGLGWRHAFADDPQTTASFGGGQSFTVSGTPVARDALVIEAGLSVEVGNNVSVGLAYGGQIGESAIDHNVSARLSYRF